MNPAEIAEAFAQLHKAGESKIFRGIEFSSVVRDAVAKVSAAEAGSQSDRSASGAARSVCRWHARSMHRGKNNAIIMVAACWWLSWRRGRGACRSIRGRETMLKLVQVLDETGTAIWRFAHRDGIGVAAKTSQRNYSDCGFEQTGTHPRSSEGGLGRCEPGRLVSAIRCGAGTKVAVRYLRDSLIPG